MTGPATHLIFIRLLQAAGGVVLLLVLALLFFPWNWARPAIMRYLSQTSQRSVEAEDLHVHFSPSLAPTIRLRGVRVQNAPWADKRPMANVGEVTFTFKSLWTLFDDQSLVALLELKDADVDLERQPDGLRNWRLRDPEYRGPGKYLIQRVEAHNSRLRVAHRGLKLDVTMQSSPGEDDLPTRIRFAGNYAGSPFSGDLLTSTIFSLQLTQEFFPLRGHAESAATRFDMDGRMADFLKIGAIDAQIRVAGPSLDKLHPFLRGQPPASHPYQARGHLNVDQDAFTFERFDGKIGATDIAGSISATRQGRRVWHADLRSELAHTADFSSLSFPKAEDHGASPRGAGAAAPGGRVIPDEHLAAERLQTIDAQVKLAVKKIDSPEWPALQGLNATADLRDGVLKLAPFDIAIAGGHASGQLDFDSRQRPAASHANIELRNLQLSQLIAKMRTAGSTAAPLAARVDLRGRGDTVAALLGSASGSATISMAPGRISNLLDAMLGLNGGKVVWLKLTGDHDIALNCASAVIDFRNGVGRSRELLLDTEQTRASGNATIDLRAERFDLLLTPQAKQSRLFALGSAIHAQGSFRHAEYSIAKGEAAAAPAGGGCPLRTAQAPAVSAVN
ncbi:MAG: hypothetical protein JWN73_2376 [Betaproteobacteria bacterium]|nr:hypothetical protein [Betaproteobacteria bacterium]